MAARFPDNESGFLCAVCIEPLVAERNPKLLPCGHSYCDECLDKLAVNQDGSQIVVCPECHEVWNVPSAGFPRNRFVKSAVELTQKLDKNQEFCAKHPTRIVERYCNECEIVVCMVCVADDHVIKGHKILSLREYNMQQKEKARSLIKTGNKFIRELDKCEEKLNIADEQIDVSTDETLSNMQQELQLNMDDLLNKYEAIKNHVNLQKATNKEQIKSDKIKVLVIVKVKF